MRVPCTTPAPPRLPDGVPGPGTPSHRVFHAAHRLLARHTDALPSPSEEGRGDRSHRGSPVGEPRMIPDLERRVREAEVMDDPSLAPGEHRAALVALSRVNRVSGTARRITAELARLPGGRTLRVLDIGCGGGDVAIGVARWAERRGRRIRMVGLDRSPVALAHARQAARRARATVDFLQGDVAEGLPEGPWDLVVVNLFLHHLDDDGVVALLTRVGESSHRLLAQDLVRDPRGYLLAWWGMRLLSRSRVGHVDGPRSVRAGFRKAELLELAHRAGLDSARVRTSWPSRLVLSWAREGA